MDRISALIDGELDERQAQGEFSRIKQNEKLRECWDTFHLIRDVMRAECCLPLGVNSKVSECLAQEPTVLAPYRSAAKHVKTYALSLAASVAAIGVVAWVALAFNPLNPPGSMMTEVAEGPTVPVESPASASPPVVAIPNVPSDGNMDEYLLAHQEFSPSTVFQGVVPYIRTVSTDQPLPDR